MPDELISIHVSDKRGCTVIVWTDSDGILEHLCSCPASKFASYAPNFRTEDNA